MIIRDLKGNGFNAIEIEVTYDKGGYNYFNYEPKKRGYYLRVQPLNVSELGSGYVKQFVAFTGVRDFILEVGRRSAKAEKLAKEMVLSKWDEYRDYILREYDVDLSRDLIEKEL